MAPQRSPPPAITATKAAPAEPAARKIAPLEFDSKNGAADLLGIARSTVYRIANGSSEVPEVVVKLLDMYQRHGVPEQWGHHETFNCRRIDLPGLAGDRARSPGHFGQLQKTRRLRRSRPRRGTARTIPPG